MTKLRLTSIVEKVVEKYKAFYSVDHLFKAIEQEIKRPLPNSVKKRFRATEKGIRFKSEFGITLIPLIRKGQNPIIDKFVRDYGWVLLKLFVKPKEGRVLTGWSNQLDGFSSGLIQWLEFHDIDYSYVVEPFPPLTNEDVLYVARIVREPSKIYSLPHGTITLLPKELGAPLNLPTIELKEATISQRVADLLLARPLPPMFSI